VAERLKRWKEYNETVEEVSTKKRKTRKSYTQEEEEKIRARRLNTKAIYQLEGRDFDFQISSPIGTLISDFLQIFN
jgi:hypothetical protein